MKVTITIQERNKHTDGKILFKKQVIVNSAVGWQINDSEHRATYSVLRKGIFGDEFEWGITVMPRSLVIPIEDMRILSILRKEKGAK